ncbi:MAG TPA: hypothetical protein VGE12_12845 [Noviherbaspirillum sp.]
MSRKTALLTLLTVSALTTACGGGGNDMATTVPDKQAATDVAPVTTTPPPSTPPAPPAPPPDTNTPPTAGGTGGDAAPGSTPPPSDPAPAPFVERQFDGYLQLVSNQIVYIRTNRILYLPVTLSEFEGSTGIVDLAAGSRVARVPNLERDAFADGCTLEKDGTCGIQPTAVAPSAPIAGFGLRIGTHVLPEAGDRPVANQKSLGRIAFDLNERADSPGLGTNAREVMRFVIDNVEMETGQEGQLIAARLREGARIHVYGRNAAGVEVRESIPAPANTVRLLPLTDIPDSNGDTTSLVLFMDLEAGFSQAGERLAALNDIAGHFSMHVTLSSVPKIERPAAPDYPGFPAVPRRDLVGEAITVNTQVPVTGGGISGSAWIRMYPPY